MKLLTLFFHDYDSIESDFNKEDQGFGDIFRQF